VLADEVGHAAVQVLRQRHGMYHTDSG
jgi:hypothetical protein